MTSENSDRRSVRSAVAAIAPGDERETLAREQILAALESLDDPFSEHAGSVHVTASAVLVGARGTVLHVHRRLGRWLQPGGHIEPGELPYETALRESEEETGIPLSHPTGGPRLIHVDVHAGARGHTHLDLRYLLLAGDADPAPRPGESPQVRWWPWDEAEAVADVALVGALRIARTQPEARTVAEVMGQNGPDDGR